MVTTSAIEIYLDTDQAKIWGNLEFQYNDIGVVLPNDTHSTIENISTRIRETESFYQPSFYMVTLSQGAETALESPYYAILPTVEVNGEPVKSISEGKTSRSGTGNYIL